MSDRSKSPSPGFLRALGFDWLPEVIGRRVFPDWPPKPDRKYQDIVQALGDGASLSSDETRYLEERCIALLDNTNGRIDSLQQKANNLIAATGISTTLAVGLGGLLLTHAALLGVVRWPLAVLFGLTTFSFLFAVGLALRVVAVGHHNYEFMEPSADDILTIPSRSLDRARIENAASLFFSHLANSRIADRKASYLIGAQTWFRNAVVLMLAVSLLIAYASMGPVSTTPSSATPPFIATQTNTPRPDMSTQTPVTVASPTRTTDANAFGPLIPPSLVPTAMPGATRSLTPSSH